MITLKHKLTLLLAITITSALFVACNDKDEPLIFEGKLVGASGCKSFSSKNDDSFLSSKLLRVNYNFDAATNKLMVTHFNALFNCCPDSLYSVVSLINDTILIREFAKAAACRCTCLYDLDNAITGVEAKKYTIRIIVYGYKNPDIIFDIDLKKIISGSVTIETDEYPWNN